ncbi:hypothetical protein [Streptomyces winkii]|uniref:hypothetical protein n=1 Tax=Streptomyces winkii TaxID=3051178 RepID=UPI0028D0BFF8|nr:hypothetical protein [Streptomyces sp. DSM 40971]
MPRETAEEEMERLDAERRRYELTLAGTTESETDRRAHLRDWADRRTAEIDELHDKRPLGLRDKIVLGGGATVTGVGCFAFESWASVALGVVALVLLDDFRTGVVVRLTRRTARKLTRRRSHWEQKRTP